MMSGTITVLQICQDGLHAALCFVHHPIRAVHRFPINTESRETDLPQIGVFMAPASIASDGAIARRQQI